MQVQLCFKRQKEKCSNFQNPVSICTSFLTRYKIVVNYFNWNSYLTICSKIDMVLRPCLKCTFGLNSFWLMEFFTLSL